jgi:NTP pyrophosphatase (non-canonical NTP hydrolase)
MNKLKLKRILTHFGNKSQIEKLVEELLELALAIQHSKSPRYKLLNHGDYIQNEIADVFIMLNQALIIYNIENIDVTIEYKLNRTIDQFKIK